VLPENELCVSRKPLARDELVMVHRANGTLVLREDDNHHKKQLPQQPPRATHDLSGPFPGVRLSFFDFASTSDSHTTHLPRSAHAHALRWHNSNIKPRGTQPFLFSPLLRTPTTKKIVDGGFDFSQALFIISFII
jgi:hypothetical protein